MSMSFLGFLGAANGGGAQEERFCAVFLAVNSRVSATYFNYKCAVRQDFTTFDIWSLRVDPIGSLASHLPAPGFEDQAAEEGLSWRWRHNTDSATDIIPQFFSRVNHGSKRCGLAAGRITDWL
jgi:hypothetical protein